MDNFHTILKRHIPLSFVVCCGAVYRIIMGTMDQDGAADLEFVLRPYMNTAKKRRFMSEEDPW